MQQFRLSLITFLSNLTKITILQVRAESLYHFDCAAEYILQ